MHELGIVFHVIKTVEEVAQEQKLSKVSKVVLEVGEVSTVIPEYLEDCWKWACKRSELMKESELVHEKIEAITYCENCKKTYETVKYAKVCPYCNSENTYLIQGNEVQIKEIEAL